MSHITIRLTGSGRGGELSSALEVLDDSLLDERLATRGYEV